MSSKNRKNLAIGILIITVVSFVIFMTSNTTEPKSKEELYKNDSSKEVQKKEDTKVDDKKSEEVKKTENSKDTKVSVDNSSYEEMTRDIVSNLVNSHYDLVVKNFNEKMAKALSADKLKDVYEKTTSPIGLYKGIQGVEALEKDGYIVNIAYLEYEKKGLKITISYDSDKKIAGLFINLFAISRDHASSVLPSGISETKLLIGEDSEWKLNAAIMGQSEKKSKVAVLLVHGSGPSDMDETVMNNKPFRDIAIGLAQAGVDTLRYDKRTYLYGDKMGSNITVYEETIDDAIKAGKILKSKGYDKVYLLGHSLGGMLAPRIYDESGDIFSGLIIMAGSPRNLCEIIIDQNNYFIDKMTNKAEAQSNKKIVDAEIEKYKRIDSLKEYENIFGLPVPYIRDMMKNDTAKILQKDKFKNLPILILQGDKDFQVYADVDFKVYKDILKDNKNVAYKLYNNLNHLFMTSSGVMNIEEYKDEGHVDEKVIGDIAEFVKR